MPSIGYLNSHTFLFTHSVFKSVYQVSHWSESCHARGVGASSFMAHNLDLHQPKPRFVYRGLEARDDPCVGLTASDPSAALSLHEAVSAHVLGRNAYKSQFIHCSLSAVAAIFYGSKWQVQGDSKVVRIVKIDLQKVDGCLLHDISSVQGAQLHGLRCKALQLATDSKEIVLLAAPPSGPLIIPPAALTAYTVPLSELCEEQRAPLRKWARWLDGSGQRMKRFCDLNPPRLEASIVERIYAPRVYFLDSGTKLYHFNGACPGVSSCNPQSQCCPEGWRACPQCMLLGTDDQINERQEPRASPLLIQQTQTTILPRQQRQLIAVISEIVKTSMSQKLAAHSLEMWISHVGGTFGSTHPELCRLLRERYGSFKTFVAQHLDELPCLRPNGFEIVTLELRPRRTPSMPVCHFFWYALNHPSGPLEVPLLNLYSLRSAAIHHTVWLWCYQPFANLPATVITKDANELLSYVEFENALNDMSGMRSTVFTHKRKRKETRGRHVAHLSDLVRVRILRRFGGWWLDMDTIVLRRLPTALPYYFSTIPEKDGSQMVKNGGMWAGHNPDFPQWHGRDSFQNTPIYIKHVEDPLIIELDIKLTDLVLNKHALPWLQVIRDMESIIVFKGLQRYVFPPIWFCPYPFWTMDACKPLDFVTHAAHASLLPSVNTVLQRSYAVQTFFMSSSTEQTGRRDNTWLRQQMRCDSHFRRLIDSLFPSTGD